MHTSHQLPSRYLGLLDTEPGPRAGNPPSPKKQNWNTSRSALARTAGPGCDQPRHHGNKPPGQLDTNEENRQWSMAMLSEAPRPVRITISVPCHCGRRNLQESRVSRLGVDVTQDKGTSGSVEGTTTYQVRSNNLPRYSVCIRTSPESVHRQVPNWAG